MKTRKLLNAGYVVAALMLIASVKGYAQLANGGVHARFGVDADTRSGHLKLGPLTGAWASDDWFGGNTGTSRGVIDTTNFSFYKSALQAGDNISFSKGMSFPLHARISNTIWLDATYARDYITGASVDSTAFISSGNNTDDPSTWHAGEAGLAGGHDLVDVYTHLRRNGLTISDSLWLFAAASTTATSGDRYFDVELYKNKLTFDRASGSFGSGGPNLGHTAWQFDAAGNITQTGDLIVTVNYTPGTVPVIDVRIWVARTTFNTLIPANFNFGAAFNAKTGASAYGYASIVLKSGTTAFGSGIGNYTASVTDTSYAGPWGSHQLTAGISSWTNNYQPSQFVEIGINLSRIGIDPAMYPAIASVACQPIFQSIIYKSRTSSAFDANLADFVGPLDFMRTPVLDHTIRNDTISCIKPVGSLRVNSITTIGFYQWKTPGGATISTANLAFNRSGKYILEASPAPGCAVTRRDTIIVLADSIPPVATASAGTTPDFAHIQLYGGDTTASNTMTPFGGSSGITFSWSGPYGFTSTLQNPVADSNGTYTLTVTEARNGCKSTVNTSVTLALLSESNLDLKAASSLAGVKLTWSNINGSKVTSYDIERRTGVEKFAVIGTVAVVGNKGSELSYSDASAVKSNMYYRVSYKTMDGRKHYSNTIMVRPAGGTEELRTYSYADASNLYLHVYSDRNRQGTVQILNQAGMIVSTTKLQISKGDNSTVIKNSNLTSDQVYIILLYLDRDLVYSQLIMK